VEAIFELNFAKAAPPNPHTDGRKLNQDPVPARLSIYAQNANQVLPAAAHTGSIRKNLKLTCDFL
tara:strand:+ start:266 stop:460 length:195 start_codon:yes stop_codon:yes gene_type:complete